jgi:hypothetical protein
MLPISGFCSTRFSAVVPGVFAFVTLPLRSDFFVLAQQTIVLLG